MSRDHKTTAIFHERDQEWYAKCNCGWSTGANRFLHKWEVEDLILGHQANVQRALAALHRSQSTMQKERDWARERIDDPLTPPAARKVWQILYDGYCQRLNDMKEVSEDPLF